MRNKKVSTYCNGIRLLLKAQCHKLLPQLSYIYGVHGQNNFARFCDFIKFIFSFPYGTHLPLTLQNLYLALCEGKNLPLFPPLA